MCLFVYLCFSFVSQFYINYSKVPQQQEKDYDRQVPKA